jgi:UPF0755 protein
VSVLAKERVKNKTVNKLRLFIIVIVLLAALAAFWYARIDDPLNLKSPVTVTIQPGSGAKQIARVLHENKVIRNALAFRLYARRENIEALLKPGEYIFNGEVSLNDIAAQLIKGQIANDDIKITIPEGLTDAKTAALLEEKGVVSAAAFMDYAQNGDFPYEYLPPRGQENRLEGFLFPETYMIGASWGEEEIIDMLLAQFTKVWTDEWNERAGELDMTPLEIITLASIIEKEARVNEDRPLISSVFYNRLNTDMALQSCATVQFILGVPKDPLLYEDLEIESPYNTYKYKGLPPGPIASPGEASIEAALFPADTDYFYFVAKKDGSHHFSRTLAEHNAASAKYLN